ncbi:MAG: hypothetical protein K2H07_06795 [Lachnospiraceae bacterium]|nr:hypothetical protein [Lachnospiraceae bacterium]
MQKLKVYFDTSVISHLAQEDVYLSTVTLEEINDCSEPKRSELLKYMVQMTILC